MKSFFEAEEQRKLKPRAVVVGVYKKSSSGEEHNESLDEIISLCKTAGGRVVGRLTQYVDRFNSSTLIGSGKVDELSMLLSERKANLIVIDTILAPSQQMNLEKKLNVQVIDRPGLILDIFALHAQTREARAQVELAQFEYLLPRLAKGWTHLERQEGSIGTRGPGETQLETDRRIIRQRITDLKKKLKSIEGERHIQRKQRKSLFKTCLVGYTNAGKSTLFNLLTGEDVLAENYLFATLDSTTRKLKLSGKNEILVSDTVGFIKRLPVSLVASFKSTLLEVLDADLLLNVIDLSSDKYEDDMNSVMEVLKEIKCDKIPMVHIFNKIDNRNEPDLFMSLLRKYPGSRFVSALTGEGISNLISSLENHKEGSNIIVIADIPADQGEKMSMLGSFGHILDSTAENNHLFLKVKIPQKSLGKLDQNNIDYKILDS